MKTKHDFTWNRTCSALPTEEAKVAIPAGAPVHYHEKNKEYYVVPSFFGKDTILSHDATYYGCRVAPDNVDLE